LRHIDLDLSWLLELHNRIDALRAGQAKAPFVYPSPPPGYPGDPQETDRALFLEAVWNNARQAAIKRHRGQWSPCQKAVIRPELNPFGLSINRLLQRVNR